MKKVAGKSKGGAFERLVCKQLSLWWTNGKRDDVFYRTASSGGRATLRSKRGARTFGGYGDIQAADPIGQPLMDLCVIECKDGYAASSIADLLDKDVRHKPIYEQFIKQAKHSARDRGGDTSKSWLLIARRRGRQIMIYMPRFLYVIFENVSRLGEAIPTIRVYTHKALIWGTPLQTFLNLVKPSDIKRDRWMKRK